MMLKSVRLAAVLALLASPAPAQTRTLVVAGYAGAFETIVRAEIIPAFERKFGARVEYVPGSSSETLAKLQAEKGGRTIDVAIADNGPMHQAIRLGLCAPIEGLPTADLYNAARFKDDKAVALGLVGTGLMYNAKFFKDKGWAAPTSWNDLKDPKYRKLIVMPSATKPYGLEALVMLARLNGGGEKNIDPGFKAIDEEVDANVVGYAIAPADIATLFRAGQSQLAVWGSGRAQYFARTDFLVDFVYPKEGAPAVLASACPVAKADASPLASEFIKALLEPDLQLRLAKDFGYAPANKQVVVPPELSRLTPVGERAAALINLDWDTINVRREEWIGRWKREMERRKVASGKGGDAGR